MHNWPKKPNRFTTNVEAIRRSSVVYADETGWRIGVLSAWLWVFTSERITVYTIQQSRAHEVVVKILGREFDGVLVSDCFTAYDAKALDGWLKQKCFAHLLREFANLETEKTRGAVRFPRALLSVLRDALALREEKPQLSQMAFQARVQELEQRLDAQIDARRQFSDPDNARLAKRLRKQRVHLFTFLTTEGVEATNNRAERALRPAVIVRKTGGCNRHPIGAKTHQILASLLVTVKQQGGNPLEALVRVLTGQGAQLASQLQRSPPWTLNKYNSRNGLFLSLTIGECAREGGHFCNPASIFFLFDFDHEIHRITLLYT